MWERAILMEPSSSIYELSGVRLYSPYIGHSTEGSAIILQPTRAGKEVETRQPSLITNRLLVFTTEPHLISRTVLFNLRALRKPDRFFVVHYCIIKRTFLFYSVHFLIPSPYPDPLVKDISNDQLSSCNWITIMVKLAYKGRSDNGQFNLVPLQSQSADQILIPAILFPL